ncbi:MAG TPA: bacteriohemerythrin [Azospirillum sp.]|nr:bacteriohemerythrin [Azospirillum sp.]
MQVVEWTAGMSVGSDTLDGHHRMIIDCLNRLGPLIGQSGREDEIKDVLATLEEFVLVHFSEEEQQMRAAGYPDWRAHKALHDRMYDAVFALKSDVEHGRVPEAEKLRELLNDWLVSHILGEDRKYVPFLENPHPENKQVWERSNGRRY